MTLKNKFALVTGGSKGIGKAIAVTLAKEGTQVAINYNTDAKGAGATLDECNKHSKGHFIVKADLRNDSAAVEMFNKIDSRFDRLDILINNAGIAFEEDTYDNLSNFDAIYHTNFLSPVRVTKYALERMKHGKIVNISSISGKLDGGDAESVAYSAFKAALNSYTVTMSKVVAPHILVNAVSPGRTHTPIWGELSKSDVARLGNGQLIQRMIEPTEVADAVLFLVKNDAMTGEILGIDGGR